MPFGSLAFFESALRGKVASVPDGAGIAGEKIRIERENDIGFIEVINDARILAKRHPCPFSRVVTSGRLVLVPTGFREVRKQRVDLMSKRGRRNGFG